MKTFKVALALSLSLGGLLAPAVHAVTLLRDTLDMRTTPQTAPFDLIQNASNDSVIIDSIRVRAVRVSGNMAQLMFTLREGASPNYRVNLAYSAQYMSGGSGGSFFTTSASRVSIPPQATVRMEDALFDHCIFCPTAKSSATSAIGDTLKAQVIFYSATGNDSILFLSKERVSSGVLSARPGSVRGGSYRFVDPAGRTIPMKASQRLKAPGKAHKP
jgi:hypothetical protein